MNILTSLTSNWKLKAGALAAAVAIWFGVAISQNAPSTLTLNNIPINVRGLSTSLVIVGKLPKASVEIAGLQSYVKSVIPSKDLYAYINMSHIHGAGEYVVRVRINLYDRFVTLVSIMPSSVNVFVDKISTRVVSVNVQLEKPVSPNWNIVSLTTSPPRVSVVGPESLLKNVKAVAAFPLAIGYSSIEYGPVRINLELPDKSLLSYLKVNPSSVFIFVKATRISGTNEMTVVYHFSGALPAGYQITNVVTSPLTVAVTAPINELNSLGDVINLPSISLNGATSDIVQTFYLPNLLPSNAKVSPSFVTVHVYIAKLSSPPSSSPSGVGK